MFIYVCVCVCVPQQAYNAAVAINHMRKLQLAHSEMAMRQNSVVIPEVNVIEASTIAPAVEPHKEPNSDEVNGNLPASQSTVMGHVSVPHSCSEPRSHYEAALSGSQSGPQPTRPHGGTLPIHAGTLTNAERGKHVYQSEPANLNG